MSLRGVGVMSANKNEIENLFYFKNMENPMFTKKEYSWHDTLNSNGDKI